MASVGKALSGHWTPDKEAKRCFKCKQEFTLFRRRHHCRACGHCFCGECCRKRAVHSASSSDDGKQRLCVDCGRGMESSARSGITRSDSVSSMGSFVSGLLSRKRSSSAEGSASSSAPVPPPPLPAHTHEPGAHSTRTSIANTAASHAGVGKQAYAAALTGQWEFEAAVQDVCVDPIKLEENYNSQRAARPEAPCDSLESYTASVTSTTLDSFLSSQPIIRSSWRLSCVMMSDDGTIAAVQGTSLDGVHVVGALDCTCGLFRLAYSVPAASHTQDIHVSIVTRLCVGKRQTAMRGTYVSTSPSTGITCTRHLIAVKM